MTAASDKTAAEKWMHKAAQVAAQAKCLRAHCGTVIVSQSEIIGRGYNAPPRDDATSRTCLVDFRPTAKEKYDRTCCMHAEWRAILDALRRAPDRVPGSQLYFVRVDDQGNIKFSGQPYCTVCSRFALDVGIRTFALWHEDGIREYSTDEYNRLSYEFFHPVAMIRTERP